jgi:hypothetical protein
MPTLSRLTFRYVVCLSSLVNLFFLALTSTAAYSMHHEGTSADAASGFYAGVALIEGGSDPFFGESFIRVQQKNLCSRIRLCRISPHDIKYCNTWRGCIWIG